MTDPMATWLRRQWIHSRFRALLGTQPCTLGDDPRAQCYAQAVAEWEADNPDQPVPPADRVVPALDAITGAA